MSSRSHPNCWGPDGHVCVQLSGRKCIDCGQPAGTLWGPYWCPDCDVKRLDKISANLEGMLADLCQAVVIIPKRGVTFTHHSFLDKDRQPARMRITSVRQSRVYYTYADETPEHSVLHLPSNKGAFYMDRDTWTKRYGQTA